MKRVLAAVLVTGMASAVIAQERQSLAPLLYEGSLPLLYSLSYSSPRVMILDEASGAGRLRRLAEAPAAEQSWLYLPASQQWMNVGHDASDNAVWLDVPLITSTIMTYDSIIHYHFHPCERRGLTELRQAADQALPSAADVSTMIAESEMMLAFHPAGAYKSKICTCYGIVEYDLLNEGLERFRIQQQNIVPFAEDFGKRLHLLAQQGASLDELLKAANTPPLRVTLTPYADGQDSSVHAMPVPSRRGFAGRRIGEK